MKYKLLWLCMYWCTESPLPLHGLLGEGAHKPDKYRVLSGETFTGTLFMLNTYFYMFDIGYSNTPNIVLFVDFLKTQM